MSMKVYSGTVSDCYGKQYSQRYLMTKTEFNVQFEAGVLPLDTCEVIGMQEAADLVTAGFESQNLQHLGVKFQ